MNIYIDGEEIEIEIQNEKTLHDLIVSVTAFLNNQKQLVTEIKVEGEPFSSEMESLPIDSSKKIEITTFLYLEFILFTVQKTLEALKAKKKEEVDSLLKDLTESPAMIELVKPHLQWKEADPSSNQVEEKTLENNLLSILDDLENCFPKWEAMKDFMSDFLTAKKESLAVMLQTGKVKIALAEIAQLAEYLTFLNRVTPLIVSLDDEVKIKEGVATIQPILAEMITSIEEDDKVLLGDLIEYELTPPLENFYKFLESISNKG